MFITGASIKIISSNTAVFKEKAISYFWDTVHLLQHYPIKLLQNLFDSFNCTNQTGIQISKLSYISKETNLNGFSK